MPAVMTFALLALACASPEQARHPSPTGATLPAPSSAAAAQAGGGDMRRSEAGSRSAGGASNSDVVGPRPAFSHVYPVERRVDLAAWLKAHGARGVLPEKDCWELQPGVGAPPAPGLLCVITQGPPIDKLARIYRLEASRLKRVWHATIGTHANWLALVPLLVADGSRIELYDVYPDGCERALCRYREQEGYGIVADFEPVLRRGCEERGEYDYQGGVFVHTKRPGPKPPRLPAAVMGGPGCDG
jgi:hypothetical protein